MPGKGEAGFTLVEVLVTLVMAAVLTAILFDGAAVARRRSAHAIAQQEAIFIARTLLTRAASTVPSPPSASGVSNGVNWRLDEQTSLIDPRGLYKLVSLTATVSDKHGKLLFAASTRRLQAVPRS